MPMRAGRGGLQMAAGAQGRCWGIQDFLQPRPLHPSTQLRRGVCTQCHDGKRRPSLALPSPPACGNVQHLLQKEVKKRMGDRQQQNYQAVLMAPSSCSDKRVIFPPPKRRKIFKESGDADGA